MSFGGFIRRTFYWTRDYLNGKQVWQHYSDIHEILEENKINKQTKHLENLLNHVKVNSNYYRIGNFSNLSSFPVLNKELIRKHYEDMVIPFHLVPFQKGNLHIQRTSGSTGMPLAVPQDSRKRNRRIAELKYFGSIAGYKSHEKLAQLRIWTKWHNKSKLQSIYENIYPVDCSKIDDEMLINLVRLIQTKRITAIWGYASWYDRLVEFVEKNKIELPSLKIAIAGSEMLQPVTRKKLNDLLKCEVVSRYSNEEQGILGQDRHNDAHYYLNHASYYFEFLSIDNDEPAKPGELCRIVVTDLFNYAFPMIRYDTGDTGIYSWVVNDGQSFQRLDKIYGRLLDLVYDNAKNPVHPMALARILKNYDAIVLWQFIQKDFNTYQLKLKVKEAMPEADCLDQLLAVFGNDAKVEFSYVDDIPVLASGKRKPVVNEWKR